MLQVREKLCKAVHFFFQGSCNRAIYVLMDELFASIAESSFVSLLGTIWPPRSISITVYTPSGRNYTPKVRFFRLFAESVRMYPRTLYVYGTAASCAAASEK